MSQKPEKSSSDVLADLVEFGSRAELTDAELDEELREEGLDPDQLVRRVVADVRQLFRDHPPARYAVETLRRDSAAGEAEEPRPLLGILRERTRLMPSAIAERLDVSVAFLSDVNRHARSLPVRWLEELAARAERALDVSREEVLGALNTPFQYARAAHRSSAYERECPACEEILERSGMDEESRRFWLELAEDR